MPDAISSIGGETVSNTPGVTWTPGVGFTLPSAPATPAAPPAAAMPSIFPTPLPAAGIGAVPGISSAQIGSPGTSAVATGSELLFGMLDRILSAEAMRQNAISQTVDIARLMTDLERASPTRAADLAVRLGMPGHQPDLGFLNSMVGPDAMGSFGGVAGTQSLSLPFALSGRQLSFLGQNKNVMNIVNDVADRFGRPDLFSQSAADLLPANIASFIPGLAA